MGYFRVKNLYLSRLVPKQLSRTHCNHLVKDGKILQLLIVPHSDAHVWVENCGCCV